MVSWKAAVAQSGRAADSERYGPFEAEAVNQLVVGSNPTGGANNTVFPCGFLYITICNLNITMNNSTANVDFNY
jgi:hypothetical protein